MFNTILYNRTGRVRVLRRLTKTRAIDEAKSWAVVAGNYASVRRISDGALVGETGYVSGEFRYAS